MQLLDQYIRLCAGRPAIVDGRPLEISLSEIAAILCCTLRNATLTLKKMQNQGWLVWHPGRGRGNKSVLIASVSPADLVLSMAMELVQQGEIRSSRELVRRYQDMWPGVAADYARWMSSQFGPKVMREKGNGGSVDTLRLFVDRPISVLDPAQALLRNQTHLAKHIFDCLVRFNPQTGSIEPHLAFAWEHVPGGREWTFYLRKGVLFHHGRPLAAEDVAYSLLRLSSQASPHRWITQSIQAVQVMGEHAVQIVLHEPDELFLHALSKEYLSIVPRDYTEQMGTKCMRMPVGTGPFRVVRNDDSMLVLTAFDPYFAGRPYLDRIELWCVPDLPDMAEAEVTNLLLPAAETEEAAVPGDHSWERISRQPLCFQYVSFNGAKEGPLRSLAIREALCRILAGDEWQKELGGTREKAEAWGEGLAFLQPGQPLHPSEAGRILEACGYAGETLKLYTYPDPDHVEDAEWIFARCARYGISIEIVYAVPEELARPSVLQQADLVIDSANMDEREELSLMEFVCANALSIHHHLGEELKAQVDKLLQAMKQAQAGPERKKYAASVMETLQRKHVFLPLYGNRVEKLAHPRLSKISLDAYGWIDFTRIYFRFMNKM